MAPISFEKATSLGLLKDSDVKRLAAALLGNIDEMKFNHELSAKSYGGTKDSFRVSFQKLIRTLRDSGCEVDGDGSAATPAAKAAQSTPKTGKTGSGKKAASRKKRLNESSDEEVMTPSKKPRTSGKAKSNGKVENVKMEDDELVARAVQSVAGMKESAFTDVV